MGRLGMSQSELARRVGVSQQNIAHLVSGNANGTKNLHRIAVALGTTTAYLAGETDDPDADAPSPTPLDSEARELIDHFAGLSPADRRALLQVAKSMAAGPPAPDTIHGQRGETGGESPAPAVTDPRSNEGEQP